MIRNIYRAVKQMVVAHDGEGEIEFYRPFTDADFESRCDFVDYSIVPPGTSIGLHTHGRDEEMYFIICGTGLMTVDGKESRVVKGDLILNRPGGTHGLINDSDANIELLVFQVSLC